jgi:dTDP-4-dehydrorhamnose 3,5-epimerase
MRIIKTKIKDVLIIEPDVFEDHRGWFIETYNKEKLKDLGIDASFVQHNHSFTYNKGTLRGLHLQNYPHTQAKLVRCTKGAVLDVAVDLRKDSPTYKKWVSVELSGENKKQLLIPKGFAHGFITLEDNSEFQYKVDNYYNKEHDRSIRFDDPEIGVDWGIDDPILSEKDSTAPFLKDSDFNFE